MRANLRPNRVRVFRAVEMEMFNRVTGIQHNLRKVQSRKVGRIVIPAKTEIKIPISITTKSRVTIRKNRRSRPRRLRRRDAIGTTAIGIDVVIRSS